MFESAALYKYLLVFGLLIAAGVGFPIPEEVPILMGGAMVRHTADDEPDVLPDPITGLTAAPDSRIRWWIMLPVCILGVVISDGLLYGMGRFWGPKLLETRWMKRMLAHDRRKNIEDNFQKYGVLVLLFARFLPAIRSPIFIMAGVTRVSFTRFLLADGIYAIPGVTLLFTLSFWYYDQLRDLVMRAQKAKPIIILVGLTAIAVYLFYHFFRHPVATGDPGVEMPLVGPQIASSMSHESFQIHPVDPSTNNTASGEHGPTEKPKSAEEPPASAT